MYDKSLLAPKTTIDEALSYQSLFTLCWATPYPKLKQVGGYWEPPTEGTLELNVDSVVFANIQVIGIGVILRDNNKKVIMATSLREHVEFESTTIECLAIYRDLQLCFHLGINSLQIESDCQIIMQAVKWPKEPFTMLENIAHDIRMLIT